MSSIFHFIMEVHHHKPPVEFARAGTEPIDSEKFFTLAKSGKIKAVGFDMDGVLFGTSRLSEKIRAHALFVLVHFFFFFSWKSLLEIGLGNLLSYVWHSHGFPKREVFFDSLYVCPQRKKTLPLFVHSSSSRRKLHVETNGMSVVHQGVELPSVLTAWQCGLVSGNNCISPVLFLIHLPLPQGPDAERQIAEFYEAQKDWHESEVAVFRAIAHLMLDPETFVRTRVVLSKGFSLVQVWWRNRVEKRV